MWFCEECKGRVLELNEARGFPLVPIGRHTLMHRVGVRAGAGRREIAAFHGGMMSLFRRIEVLGRFSDHRLRSHLDALGPRPDEDIALDDYLARMDELRASDDRFSKTACFEGLVRHFTEAVVGEA